MNPQIKQKEVAWKILREGQSEKALLQNLKVMDGNWHVQQKSKRKESAVENEIIGLRKDC